MITITNITGTDSIDRFINFCITFLILQKETDFSFEIKHYAFMRTKTKSSMTTKQPR